MRAISIPAEFQGDIRETPTSELLRAGSMWPGDAALVIGGPPVVSIVAALAKAEAPVRVELLRCLSDRSATASAGKIVAVSLPLRPGGRS